MGVKPFLVSAAVQAVLAQRLVRVLCANCRQQYAPEPSELSTLGLDPARADVRLWRAVGCDACGASGYRGRIGIFELMELDTTLKEMTFRGEPLERLRQQARATGMTNLYEDGVRKVLAGRTTLDELLRVTASS
jgi:type II secretory ATPase GspE/PulE/Tfp pilus assembly ATPase PilB-like protein